jgi:quercetin dioxygenase-like cupin family protein
MANNQIFAKGVKMDAHFSGTAFVNFLMPDMNGVYNCQVYDVLFEAGCRNDWHSHPGGQLLLCTDGIGYYQEKGKAARRLTKGDVVEIPPDVVHWHGAATDSAFSHIGISPNTQKGPAVWLGEVTDDEYFNATKGQTE